MDMSSDSDSMDEGLDDSLDEVAKALDSNATLCSCAESKPPVPGELIQ